MIFSLEALRARHGDSLLLHFGTTTEPRALLIDGGPGPVYGDALKPRLQGMRDGLRALGRLGPEDALPLSLMMVSHIDDDHIGGLLGLTGELIDKKDTEEPWVKPRSLWHNAFEDLADDHEGPLEIDASPQPAKSADAVMASVKQGRQLHSDAEVLGWNLNEPFKGLVMAPEHGGQTVRLDGETTLLVVSPRTDQVEGLRKEWAEQLRKLKKQEATPAEVAEYLDESPYNLSSIVCLAQQGSRRMLLTGDARGDHILDALDVAEATDAGNLHVDVLKLPHHGSIRNVEEDFFKRITADHYVISASGRDGNPESETLELIGAARAKDRFTIHLTYGEAAGELHDRLFGVRDKLRAKNENFTMLFRPDTDLSLRIDLGDDQPPV
jgi:beta-lactamase superfamily II metal-dependent hydrolase